MFSFSRFLSRFLSRQTFVRAYARGIASTVWPSRRQQTFQASYTPRAARAPQFKLVMPRPAATKRNGGIRGSLATRWT